MRAPALTHGYEHFEDGNLVTQLRNTFSIICRGEGAETTGIHCSTHV